MCIIIHFLYLCVAFCLMQICCVVFVIESFKYKLGFEASDKRTSLWGWGTYLVDDSFEARVEEETKRKLLLENEYPYLYEVELYELDYQNH
jgi:hypothetical protein